MKGMIYKTAKGYKSYEIFEVDESFIFKMTDILIDKLGFNGKLLPVIGVNGCYLDLKKI